MMMKNLHGFANGADISIDEETMHKKKQLKITSLKFSILSIKYNHKNHQKHLFVKFTSLKYKDL